MNVSLIETFERTMGPPIPPVMDRPDLGTAATPREDKGRIAAIAARFEATVAEWERQEIKFRDRVTELDIQDTAEVNALVAYLDAKADDFARSGSRAEKDYARMAKMIGRRDPARGAEFRAGCLRVLKAEERIVRGLLDLSLFMRSIRADLDKEARGGPSFETVADLDAYIASQLRRT